MATKKAPAQTKKPAVKKPAAKKPAAKKPAKKKAPVRATYAELAEFKKLNCDPAAERVEYLRRRLKSVRAEDTIAIRNQNVKAVSVELEQAIAERDELFEDFQALKREVYADD